MSRLASMLVLLFLTACAASGSSPSSRESADRDLPAACGLLETEEVARFVGEPVHEPRASEVAPSVGDTTCLWADADPADPGHLLSVTVTPKNEVGEPEPGSDDKIYDLSTLGDDSFGAQQPDGAVRVVFATDARWVDLVYEVLPSRFMPDGAIDDLIRLAEQVRARVLDSA